MDLYTIRRNREVIFLESLREVNSRINQRTPYNLVRLSAILRFLLIDGSKFYNEINRPYKLKFKTPIKGNSISSTSISSAESEKRAYTILSYEYDANGEYYKLEDFLKLPIVKIYNSNLKAFLKENNVKEEYNINEIIKLVANAHGGVHFEKWDNIPNDLMTDSSSPFNINTNSKLHDTIRNIADITLLYLKPLTDLVYNNIKKSGSSIGAETSATFYIK